MIELRAGDRVRSRAFGQLTLARILIDAGRIDEAAAVGRAVCAVVPGLTSSRVRARLDLLGDALSAHRDEPEARVFLSELAAVGRADERRTLDGALGGTIRADRVLVLDWVGPHGPWDDQLVFVFDGGILTTEQAKALRVIDAELTGFAFLRPDEAAGRLRADIADRLDRALTALVTTRTDYDELHDSG